MSTRKELLVTAALAALFSVSGPASAAGDANIRYAAEIDSCIAEINDNVDYKDATRIRHTVVKVKNTFVGYVLAIDTDVFTSNTRNAVRAYASYCVAKGGGKPRKFSIDRISG